MRISYFWSSWEQDQSCHQWPKQRFTSSQGRVAAGAGTGTSGRVEEAAPGAQAAARDLPLAFLPLPAAPGQAGIPQRAGLLQHSPTAPPWPCLHVSSSLGLSPLPEGFLPPAGIFSRTRLSTLGCVCSSPACLGQL